MLRTSFEKENVISEFEIIVFGECNKTFRAGAKNKGRSGDSKLTYFIFCLRCIPVDWEGRATSHFLV